MWLGDPRCGCQPGREAGRSGAEWPGWLDRVWRRWSRLQAAVRTGAIIVFTPPTSDDAHLLQAVEDLAIAQFITQASVEAFDVAVLPGTARFDVTGGEAQPGEHSPHGIRDTFPAVLGPYLFGDSRSDEQTGKQIRNGRGREI